MSGKYFLPAMVLALFLVAVGPPVSAAYACCGLWNSCADCNTCDCGYGTVCGPVGHAADALLAIPMRILSSLSPCGGNCCCSSCGQVRYPRGCSFVHCPGSVADVAPHRTVTLNADINVGMPAYVTYGIEAQRPPSRPIPPVVSFNGPLSFDQGPGM